MTLQQFRFLYLMLTGQIEPDQHIYGPTLLTSRACRRKEWIVLEEGYRFPHGLQVSEVGQQVMRDVFPEFFLDSLQEQSR